MTIILAIAAAAGAIVFVATLPSTIARIVHAIARRYTGEH